MASSCFSGGIVYIGIVHIPYFMLFPDVIAALFKVSLFYGPIYSLAQIIYFFVIESYDIH